jgi:hypothetical protein
MIMSRPGNDRSAFQSHADSDMLPKLSRAHAPDHASMMPTGFSPQYTGSLCSGSCVMVCTAFHRSCTETRIMVLIVITMPSFLKIRGLPSKATV